MKTPRAPLSRAARRCVASAPAAAMALAISMAFRPALAQMAEGAARAAEASSLQSAEELIMQVSLGRYLLSDGMVVYQNEQGVLLPLDAFSRTVDFALVVSPQLRRVEGWFINESRRVELDMQRGEALVEGKRHAWPPGAVLATNDDIYVSTALMSQWFPLDFEVLTGSSEIKVTARERLPFEDVLARERLRERRNEGQRERTDLPRIEPEYRLIDWPYADITVDVGAGQDEQVDNRQRSSALIAGDLLYMGGSAFVAFEDGNELSDARFRLERRDEEARLLGPLGLTGIALGDVFTTSLPLVASSATATGINLTNQPVAQLSELDRVTLRGDVPPGWDVELYRNGALLDFGSASASGQYEFPDVPLLVGPNDLVIVLLGPQGQRREIPQRFFAGPGLIKRGETFFELFAGRHDERLVTPEDVRQDEAAGTERYVASLERGLFSGVSAALGFARVPAGRTPREYVSTGLRAQAGGVFGRLDYAQDLQSGSAAELAAATLLGEVNLSATHSEFFDFVSERSLNTGRGLVRRSVARLDAPLDLGSLPRITTGLGLEVERFEQGNERMELSSRLSTYILPAAIAHTLDAQINDGDVGNLRGELLVSTRLGLRDQVRAQVGYQADSGVELDNVAVGWNRRLPDRMQLRAELQQGFGEDRDTIASLGVSKTWDRLSAGLVAAYSEEDGFAAGANLFVSVGRDRYSGLPFTRSESMASSGVIDARTYLDVDNNSLFSAGDVSIENAGFSGSAKEWRTNKRGRAILPGFSPYQGSNLLLDPSTLEDPYWLPSNPGYRVVTRPGQSTRVEFPVTPTGEVEGTAYMRRDSGMVPASNVRLLLVNPIGRIVAETRSSYDGYYLFDKVPPGRYRLNVDPDQLARQRLAQDRLPEVPVLAGSDNYVRNFDVYLERVGSDLEKPR